MNRRQGTVADNPASETRLCEQKLCASGATTALGKTAFSTTFYKVNNGRKEAVTINRM